MSARPCSSRRSIPSSLEALEARIAPAILFGVTADQKLISFDSAKPGVILSSAPLGGVTVGEMVVGIDFRPATGALYAVTRNASDQGHLYTVNLADGAASLVTGTAMEVTLSGTHLDIDFNPMVDRLRLVSDTGQNLRINPTTGLVVDSDADAGNGVTPDSALNYGAGDANNGKAPGVTGLAYTNAFGGATTTRLFDLDTALGVLAEQTVPNAGNLATKGPLKSGAPAAHGFDILPGSTSGFAALEASGQDQLYTIDLATGAAKLLGKIGPAGTELVSLSALPSGLGIVGRTATYLDVDGDAVKVTFSKGTLLRTLFTFTAPNDLGGVQLQRLDLTGDVAGFTGASVAFTAKISAAGGNGFVDVGRVLATGLDLKSLSVKGDLGSLVVGTNSSTTPALGTLSLGSAGIPGAATSGGVMTGLTINGGVGSFTSTGGLDAPVLVSGAIKTLAVGGVLSANFTTQGSIATASFGHVQGATVDLAGSVKTLSVASLDSAILGVEGGVTKLSIAGDVNSSTLRVDGLLAIGSPESAPALGSLVVKGSVVNSQVLVSQSLAAAFKPSGLVGKIQVKHDWIESNLAVGVDAGVDALYGTADDVALSFGMGQVGEIGRLIIQGEITGNNDGLVAGRIVAATLGGSKVTLTSGFDQKLLGPTRTVVLREYQVV